MIVTAGSTNVSVYYYIVQDASATSPGEPVTGLLFSDIETGGSASYARQGAARTDLTLVTLASASAAHTDGGFILVDDTNMPGLYRCDYPDAAFATGVDQVFLQIVVASANNAVAAPILVDITDVDLRDSVRGGMTALPNAAADAAGGLPISDAGGLDLDGRLDADVSSRLAPTVAARTLDVTATGGAGIDWGNVENQSTTVDLSGTDIQLCDTVTTNTDMRGTDSALLASSAPTNFGDLAITVTTGQVTVGTNNDKTGYSISGTKTTLDVLNDFDPTSDAVANVTLVGTTTTNTDMRGTDSALLAASAPTNFGDMSITATTGLLDITQAAADKSWSTTTRVLTAGTNLNDISVNDILTTQMTEAYAADGVAPTLAQFAFITMQNLQDFSFAGTTQTVRQLDGSTTAATYTLDDGTNPTDKTRTT